MLYITLNPAAVDVNVHPAKLEVKFSNEKPVFEAIYYTVRAALEENRVRPSMVLPSTDRRPPDRMTAEEYRRTAAPTEKRVTNAFVPVDDRTFTKEKNTQMRMTMPEAIPERKPSSRGPESPATRTVERPIAPLVKKPERVEETIVSSPPVLKEENPSTEAKSTKAPEAPREEVSAPPVCPPPEAVPQSEIPTAEPAAIPDYRIIGEAFHSYVIVEKYDPEKPIVLLVDKHAAHERIIFEKLKAGMRRGIESGERISQLLMLPIDFMLTAAEIEVLSEYRREIEELGFVFETGVHTVSVSEIPEGVHQNAVADFFGVIAGRLLDNTGSAALTRDILFEKALYQASCKAAVKAGREYADEHIEYIIDSLMKLPDITFCPHGRPVAMELSKKMIDRQFKRG